jgi:type III secretion protein D
MAVSTLQLRVLNGPQRGARAQIDVGTYRLGTSGESDFVLRGETLRDQHAELTVGDGAMLLKVMDGSDAVTSLKRGELFLLGGVLLVVDAANEPWPDLPVIEESVPDFPSEQPATESEIERYEAARRNIVTITQPTRKRYGTYALPVAVGTLIAFAPLALIYFANLSLEASAPIRAAIVEDPVLKWQRDLTARPEHQQLRLTRDASGAVRLQGFVAQVTERLAVVRWVRELPEPVNVSVYSIEELRGAADEVLQRLDLPVGVNIRPDGTLHMTGVVADAATRDRVAATILEDVPGTRSSQNEITTVAELQSELVTALEGVASRQASTIKVGLDRSKVSVQGELDAAGMTAWRSVRSTLAKRLGGLAQLSDSVKASAAVAAVRRRLENLPIVSVVGGPMPYVVMEDGSRVQEGGSFADGSLLQTFGQRSLTIRDASGQLATFELP